MKRDASLLLSATMQADPPADDTIARILEGAAGAQQIADRIAAVNRALAQWNSNDALRHWHAGPDADPRIDTALRAYLAQCQALPDWADPALIGRAETLFMDMSMLSCTLLFCASLPECYVLPNLSAVLHAAGKLEQHTDYRIRATAAMIFPVMMRGGLTGAAGAGLAQALKVRLIHATIRHLVLRGPPQQAGNEQALPPLANPGPGMAQALYARGWDTARDGLPCNQEQLAYTLLTFHYVFLRGLRRLGLGLSPQDEQAYLHAWNVLGHLLGIDAALMAWNMKDAEVLFAGIQTRARTEQRSPDPRPALALALMREMENQIPLRLFKPFPVLLTRHLCGRTVSADLGLARRVPWLPHLLWIVGLAAVRGVDSLVRQAVPDFSIARMLTRVAGYRLVTRFLMDQTRPLNLPPALLEQASEAAEAWRHDPRAPRWMNRLEARLAGRAPAAENSARA